MQRNQTLRLKESLRTRPDNISKRLSTSSCAIQSSENCCMTSPGEFVIPETLLYLLWYTQAGSQNPIASRVAENPPSGCRQLKKTNSNPPFLPSKAPRETELSQTYHFTHPETSHLLTRIPTAPNHHSQTNHTPKIII